MNINTRPISKITIGNKCPPGVIALVAVLILSACSSPAKRETSNSSLFSNSTHQSSLQSQLSKHFQSWKYTPYKLGGYSRRGIDCSGFVQITFRDVFNKIIPRSTSQQGKIGHTVSRKSLKLGDLVFFQTGRQQRHVGIYIGNSRFIHASTSRGVMLSKLDSPYWSSHYWKASRVL